MNLAEKIASLLKNRGMTKTELARQMGLKDPSVITHWVKGRFRPGRGNVEKLSQIFDKPASYFEDETQMPSGEMHKMLELMRLGPSAGMSASQAFTQPVAVIGTVTGDRFQFFPDSIPDEYLPIMFAAGGARVFALKVKCRLAQPDAQEGDYMLIAKTPCVDEGKLAVMRIGGECFLRRISHRKPLNSPKSAAKGAELQGVIIEGQVVGIFRRP